MNSFACLSFLFLSLIATVNANNKCYVCGSSSLKIHNKAYHHQLQNNRLGSKTTWSCTELENAGLNRQFGGTQCGHAQDIATRFCGCNDVNYVPTVQQTPPCDFCPGVSRSSDLPNPRKEVRTGGFLGTLECGLLVDGGRNGFWPSTTCAKLRNQYNVPGLCCGSANAPPAPSGGSGLVFCLSGENMVNVQDKGTMRMEDIQIGDMVGVGDGKYSRVYSFGHRDTLSKTDYLQIHGESLAAPLEITKDHMVFVDKKGAIPASMVMIGDNLVLGEGITPVTKILSVVRKGAYAPFTESGKLVVNEVVASSFISVKEGSSSLTVGDVEVASLHWLAHAFEAPHRLVCKMSPSFCESESYTSEGISHWVNLPYQASRWLMNQTTLVQGFLSIAVLLLCSTFYVVEALFSSSTVLVVAATLLVIFRMRRSTSKCA